MGRRRRRRAGCLAAADSGRADLEEGHPAVEEAEEGEEQPRQVRDGVAQELGAEDREGREQRHQALHHAAPPLEAPTPDRQPAHLSASLRP